MKARVKATGDIIEVERVGIASDIWALQSDTTVVFDDAELDINIDPDYWEKLKHWYAGMAMQSYVNNDKYLRELREICKEVQEMRDYIADLSIALATTLVNKLKEDSQCEK